MKRNVEQEGNNIIISKFLIISEDGDITMVAREPSLSGGQIAVKLNVKVPLEFFNPAWPEATLQICDDMVKKPPIEVSLMHEFKKV